MKRSVVVGVGPVESEHEDGDRTAYVIRDMHRGEYLVELWIAGAHQKDKDVRTPDRAEAFAKSNEMVRGV